VSNKEFVLLRVLEVIKLDEVEFIISLATFLFSTFMLNINKSSFNSSLSSNCKIVFLLKVQSLFIVNTLDQDFFKYILSQILETLKLESIDFKFIELISFFIQHSHIVVSQIQSFVSFEKL
jgi:hypothetical protein